MKNRSLGIRIVLGIVAWVIGFVIYWLLLLLLGSPTDAGIIIPFVLGLAVATYLAYRWSGKVIALVVALVFILATIVPMVIAKVF
jgi:hypothetical protein